MGTGDYHHGWDIYNLGQTIVDAKHTVQDGRKGIGYFKYFSGLFGKDSDKN